MKYILSIVLVFVVATAAMGAEGAAVRYQVDGQAYEGYYISPSDKAPLVVLIHDWDGLTDYEVKRAQMLAEAGYAVFAADLFGAGVRPTEMEDKRQHTGELYKDRNKMRALLNGALETARQKGPGSIMPSPQATASAGPPCLNGRDPGRNLKGFATFHGGLATPDGQDYTRTRRIPVDHARFSGFGHHHWISSQPWQRSWNRPVFTTR